MSSLDELTNEEPKGLFYHYTTQKGLLGIIKEKELWCTSIKYLNDSQEFIYTFDLFDEILEKEIQEGLEKKFLKFIKCLFLNENTPIKEIALNLSDVYVCSFCKYEGDSLSQWRGYCKPNISGFSIGFSYEQIKKLLEMEIQKDMGRENIFFEECIYKKNKQKNKMKELIEELLNELEPYYDKLKSFVKPPGTFLGKTILPKEKYESIGNFVEKVYEFASVFKNGSFKNENEYRIVKIGRSLKKDRFDFREGKSMLIPYYKLKLANEDDPIIIDRIVIGPTPHGELSKKSLENFLKLHNVKYNEIEVSKIPFREW